MDVKNSNNYKAAFLINNLMSALGVKTEENTKTYTKAQIKEMKFNKLCESAKVCTKKELMDKLK